MKLVVGLIVLEGMVWIPGGEFSMGSDSKDESICSLPGVTRDAVPVHRVYVDGFWMDASEVTNKQFAAFVDATGYITVAEQKPTQEEFPTAPPENLVAGSKVFTETREPVPLNNQVQWWNYVVSADWRHSTGVDSNLKGRENDPVVQIARFKAQPQRQRRRRRLQEAAGLGGEGVLVHDLAFTVAICAPSSPSSPGCATPSAETVSVSSERVSCA